MLQSRRSVVVTFLVFAFLCASGSLADVPDALSGQEDLVSMEDPERVEITRRSLMRREPKNQVHDKKGHVDHKHKQDHAEPQKTAGSLQPPSPVGGGRSSHHRKKETYSDYQSKDRARWHAKMKKKIKQHQAKLAAHNPSKAAPHISESTDSLVGECAEALKQQEKGNKLKKTVHAYNLMHLPSSLGSLANFPPGPYTTIDVGQDTASGNSDLLESQESPHQDDKTKVQSKFKANYFVPNSNRSCPQKMQEKNIHFIWFGLYLPDEFTQNLINTALQNPKWTVMLWHDIQDTTALMQRIKLGLRLRPQKPKNIVLKFAPDHYDSFVNGDLIRNEPDPNPALRSDWMRLEVVYKYGGIYLDTDTISLKPFDRFAPRFQWPWVVFDHHNSTGNAFGQRGGQSVYRNICNCAFGMEAGSKFLLYAINSMKELNATRGPETVGAGGNCGVFTGAFVHYNMTGIQMLSSDDMLHAHGKINVQMQTFARTWKNNAWKTYSKPEVAEKEEPVVKDYNPFQGR